MMLATPLPRTMTRWWSPSSSRTKTPRPALLCEVMKRLAGRKSSAGNLVIGPVSASAMVMSLNRDNGAFEEN